MSEKMEKKNYDNKKNNNDDNNKNIFNINLKKKMKMTK